MASTYRKIAECDYVAFSDKQIYIWIHRDNSITHSTISKKQFDIFWAADELYSFISENYPEIKVAAETRCIYAANSIIKRIFTKCQRRDKRSLFKVAKRYATPHLKNVFFNKKAGYSTRISCLATWAGYIPSKVLWTAIAYKKNLQRRV